MTTQTGSMTSSVAAANPWAMVPALGNLDAYISAVNRLPLLTLETALAADASFLDYLRTSLQRLSPDHS